MTLLFLDIDGTLIPYGAPTPYPHHAPPPGVPAPAHPLLPRLDPALGPRLAALGCELIWATTWQDDANTVVAPWLGLPPLPVLACPEDPEPPATPRGLHWKTPLLTARAAGRPFVWLDDEITDTDRAWVTTHHPSPALLHHVDAHQGLTAEDFTTLRHWLRQAL